jgi:hypothetical protein
MQGRFLNTASPPATRIKIFDNPPLSVFHRVRK